MKSTILFGALMVGLSLLGVGITLYQPQQQEQVLNFQDAYIITSSRGSVEPIQENLLT